MPELPEVESIARTVRPLVRGQKIRCVHLFHPIAIKPQQANYISKQLERRRILGVFRNGKYLFLTLDHGLVEMHFRFDGHLIWFDSPRQLLQRANNDEIDSVHVDVALELSKGVLCFADQRHFGRLHFWPSREACPPLKMLGVDALSPDFAPEELHRLLARSKRPLKEFLLDQTRVAGIGNIYSSESLWHARLDPWRPANSLSRAESVKLHKAIVYVLRRALECCLHPAPDFRDADWWFQGIESVLRVYQREGLPCRRCGEPVRRREQAGRSTYFCKRCQV